MEKATFFVFKAVDRYGNRVYNSVNSTTKLQIVTEKQLPDRFAIKAEGYAVTKTYSTNGGHIVHIIKDYEIIPKQEIVAGNTVVVEKDGDLKKATVQLYRVEVEPNGEVTEYPYMTLDLLHTDYRHNHFLYSESMSLIVTLARVNQLRAAYKQINDKKQKALADAGDELLKKVTSPKKNSKSSRVRMDRKAAAAPKSNQKQKVKK